MHAPCQSQEKTQKTLRGSFSPGKNAFFVALMERGGAVEVVVLTHQIGVAEGDRRRGNWAKRGFTA